MSTATLPQRFGKAALDQLYRGHTHRPLLFLDFDDVICLSEPYGGYDVFQSDRPADLWERFRAQETLVILREVVEKFNPQIVITTSWLRLMEREGFDKLFALTGLDWLANRLHEAWEAPQLHGMTRADAIEKWLAARYRGEPLVVLDDDYSGTGLRKSKLYRAGRVVMCEVKRGLHAGLKPAIEKALKS